MERTALNGALCTLRPFCLSDTDALPAIADDAAVSRWMTRRFPYPYTAQDARDWIAIATSDTRNWYFAVEIEGLLAGGAGIELLQGERSQTGTLGYWLGRTFWGRGI